MWLIILPLLGGCVFSMRKPALAAKLPVVGITNLSLVLLLMVMGARIGADPQVVEQMASLGLQAIVLAGATVLGSTLLLFPLQRGLGKKMAVHQGEDGERVSGVQGHGLTLLLLGSVLVGIALGLLLFPPGVLPLLTELTTWTLGLLLLGVGLDLGASTRAFAKLKEVGWRMALIPLAIALGSILAAVLVVLFWNIMGWGEAAAVASGFGWYSLSSVLLSELHGPLLGALAFMTNVFRELMAVIVTPLVAKYLGPIPALGAAGATAMDVMLPVISKSAGREYVPLAFFSGAVLSLSVAVLVQLFISL